MNQDLEAGIASGSNIVVRLSTASLTSSSSSGSEPRAKNVTTTPELPMTQPQVNGDRNGRDNSATSSPKPSTSTGAIPKSISFDMTAARGDKDLLDDDQKNKRGFFGKLKMSLRNRRGKSLRGADDLGRCYDREAGGDGVDVGRHRLRRIMSEDTTSTASINSGKLFCDALFKKN